MIEPNSPVMTPDGFGVVMHLKSEIAGSRDWRVNLSDGIERWYAEKNLTLMVPKVEPAGDLPASSDLSRLEALAKAATDGPWIDNDHYQAVHTGAGDLEAVCRYGNAQRNAENMAYIAAADPTTILALIGQLRALTAQTDQLHDLAGILLCIEQCEECAYNGTFNRDAVKRRLAELPAPSLTRIKAEVLERFARWVEHELTQDLIFINFDTLLERFHQSERGSS